MIQRMINTRKNHGESQRALAKEIGYNQVQIARYETGENKIPVEYLLRFCEHYGVSADCILGLPNHQEAFPMFSDRLRSIRRSRKLTQQQMADALHLTLNSYQKYEQAERSPSLETLVQIADLLDVPTDFLLCRDDFLTKHGVSVDELP